MPGILYVVATPIGNLEDMTYRAVRVLGTVAVIACEDTRHSRILLDHYGIRRPTISYYRENERERAEEILDRLRAGEDVALISDAGAPLLSDPGAYLVAQAVGAGIRVTPLPGASAPITALMASGLAGEDPAAALLGFLPSRAGERRQRLAAWAAWPGVLVCFESPHRLGAALADMEETLGGGRTLVVGRELTKLHEEFLRGTVASARAHFEAEPARGEFTLVVGPPLSASPVAATAVEQRLAAIAQAGADPKAELKSLARETGVARSELYRRLQQLRGRIKD